MHASRHSPSGFMTSAEHMAAAPFSLRPPLFAEQFKRLIMVSASVVAIALPPLALGQSSSGMAPAAGDWGVRIGPGFLGAHTVNFNGGTSADLKSTAGIKIGGGYFMTDHIVLGGNFAYSTGYFSETAAGGPA